MYDIDQAKKLIAERDGIDITAARAQVERFEAIDVELASLFNGAAKPAAKKPQRKPQKCGTCGEEGHSTRTCPQKPADQQ